MPQGKSLAGDHLEAIARERFREHPDAVERCLVVVAAADGRTWWLTKDRDGGAERFFGPAERDQPSVSISRALAKAAEFLPLIQLATPKAKATFEQGRDE